MIINAHKLEEKLYIIYSTFKVLLYVVKYVYVTKKHVYSPFWLKKKSGIFSIAVTYFGTSTNDSRRFAVFIFSFFLFFSAKLRSK